MEQRGDLDRFVQAQAGVYEKALAELRAGRKRSHWMWFVFPQLRGLGRSPTAHFYGIAGLGEAVAYLGHPLLGARLRQCVEAAALHAPAGPRALFGSPDDLKFRSCLTLFAEAAGPGSVFHRALSAFYEGPDPLTLERLRRAPGPS